MSCPQKAQKQQWNVNLILVKQVLIVGEMATIPGFSYNVKPSVHETQVKILKVHRGVLIFLVENMQKYLT